MKKLAYLSCFLILIVSQITAQNKQATIEVVGKAAVKDIPEEIVFGIPIRIIDSSYLGCNDRLKHTLNELQLALKKKGIAEESVHTSNYSIAENMVYEGGKRIQQGFKGTANMMLSANYSTELVQKVLESIKRFELNYNIHFSLSESQKERLTKIAMVEAVQNARQKSEILAGAAQIELGEIVKISYGNDSYRPEPLMSERTLKTQMDASGSNELNLSPSQVSLYKSVLIIWSIN